MLNKHELPVPKEEMEKVDTLRYSWSRLQALACEVSSHLLQIQPQFRGELIENVKIFVQDCQNYYSDYEKVRQYQHFFLEDSRHVAQYIYTSCENTIVH